MSTTEQGVQEDQKPLSTTQAQSTEATEPKVYHFNCDTCGRDWTFAINRQGVKRCKDCAEIRRSINGFLNRDGIDVSELRRRVNKLLKEAEEVAKAESLAAAA